MAERHRQVPLQAQPARRIRLFAALVIRAGTRAARMPRRVVRAAGQGRAPPATHTSCLGRVGTPQTLVAQMRMPGHVFRPSPGLRAGRVRHTAARHRHRVSAHTGRAGARRSIRPGQLDRPVPEQSRPAQRTGNTRAGGCADTAEADRSAQADGTLSAASTHGPRRHGSRAGTCGSRACAAATCAAPRRPARRCAGARRSRPPPRRSPPLSCC